MFENSSKCTSQKKRWNKSPCRASAKPPPLETPYSLKVRVRLTFRVYSFVIPKYCLHLEQTIWEKFSHLCITF